MSAQHTQGKWQVGGTFDNDGVSEIVVEVETPAGKLAIAVALAGLEGQEANAQLIAAAPDLLKALRSLVDKPIRFIDGTVMEGQIEWKQVDKARAAIARATSPKANTGDPAP